MMFLRIHGHEDLEYYWGSPLLRASEKGYPEIYDEGVYWVMFKDQLPIAYTTSIECDGFVFVGNTYVRKEFRRQGLHSQLLEYRNKRLGEIPKLTVLNPIEGSSTFHLIKVISRLGYKKIEKLADISDLMTDLSFYGIDIEKQEVWRLDYGKKEYIQ